MTILWASFKSLGVAVPLGELVVGFFVGMAANLAPAPAGVGAVDGGLIGAFAIFGYPLETVIAAVLIYRLIAFWLPVPPGIVAFFQLRATVARWEQEREAGELPGPAEPSPRPGGSDSPLHKVKYWSYEPTPTEESMSDATRSRKSRT